MVDYESQIECVSAIENNVSCQTACSPDYSILNFVYQRSSLCIYCSNFIFRHEMLCPEKHVLPPIVRPCLDHFAFWNFGSLVENLQHLKY